MTRSPIADFIDKLTINQIKGYLVSGGWVEDGEIGSIATVWHRPSIENSDFEILLPEDDSIKDYLDRVIDIFHVLSEFENKREISVLEEVLRFYSDLVRVRVVHEDVANGTIPLEDGVLLIEKVRELISSATLSTLSRKKYFSGNRPQEAVDFIGKARLGQTEVGSYVVNVLLPIEKPEPTLFELMSFTRCVMTTLVKSLDALDAVVEQLKIDESMSLLEDSIAEGVSANLCDALIGLSGDGKSRDVEISISLSRTEAGEMDSHFKYSLTNSSIQYLEKASDYLKENYVINDVTITGMVKKLDRVPGEESGVVSVLAFVGDRERSVSFDLGPKEYLDAIHAHENKQTVEYKGDVYISPRSAKLINGHDFRVYGSANLFEE